MSIIIIMSVCFSKYIYRYIDTFAKIDGKEMEIILNKDMNSESCISSAFLAHQQVLHMYCFLPEIKWEVKIHANLPVVIEG